MLGVFLWCAESCGSEPRCVSLSTVPLQRLTVWESGLCGSPWNRKSLRRRHTLPRYGGLVGRGGRNDHPCFTYCVWYFSTVLLFPCVWLQRVVKRRVMGDVTWQKLALRRVELRLAAGERDGGFLSPPDIIAASNAHQSLRRRVAQEGREPASIGPGSQGRLSTPRKVLPVE
jgi:hypothetical protein